MTLRDIVELGQEIEELEAEVSELRKLNESLRAQSDAYLANLEASQTVVHNLKRELAETERLLRAATAGELMEAIRP